MPQDGTPVRMAQTRKREARKACLDGDAPKGVSLLSDLFLDTKNPTYIFNQGRCLQQNGRYSDAVVRFEEFLRAPETKTTADDRAAAEKHLADCRERLSQERDGTGIQPAPQPFVVPSGSQGPGTTSTLPPPVVQNAPSSAGRSRSMVVAGIVTGAVGAVAIAGGVVMAMKANSLADDMENGIGGYSVGKQDDQKTYKTLSWVGYGVGAACVATGAVLIGLGIRSGGEGKSADVALVPTFGPGQVGAVLKGGF